MITDSTPDSPSGPDEGDYVRVRKDLPSGTIILDRPDRKNALTLKMIQQLKQAFFDFHQERQVRTVILMGKGDYFCSGTDLREVRDLADTPDAMEQWRQSADDYAELLETMLRFPKPIIAAVNGPALGIGAGLVVASDLTVAGDNSSIGWPEPQRGLVANLTAPLLRFRVGGSVAARFLLTGRSSPAAQAHSMGLFQELVTPDLVWARAQELSQQCAECAPQALQLTKQMLNETLGEELFTQHAIGAAHHATARTLDAACEGILAFLEKRDPDWDKPQSWTGEP